MEGTAAGPEAGATGLGPAPEPGSGMGRRGRTRSRTRQRLGIGRCEPSPSPAPREAPGVRSIWNSASGGGLEPAAGPQMAEQAGIDRMAEAGASHVSSLRRRFRPCRPVPLPRDGRFRDTGALDGTSPRSARAASGPNSVPETAMRTLCAPQGVRLAPIFVADTSCGSGMSDNDSDRASPRGRSRRRGRACLTWMPSAASMPALASSLSAPGAGRKCHSVEEQPALFVLHGEVVAEAVQQEVHGSSPSPCRECERLGHRGSVPPVRDWLRGSRPGLHRQRELRRFMNSSCSRRRRRASNANEIMYS